MDPVYDEDCRSCHHAVGKDGDSLVVYRNRELTFLSIVDGTLEATSPSHLLDRPAAGVASSPGWFYASDPDPIDDDYGAIVARPRDRSGIASDDVVVVLAPSASDVDPRARFGASFAVDGDAIVAGAPGDRDGSGSAFVRRSRDDPAWVKRARNFGRSVLVRDDAVVVAAAVEDGAVGAVFFYGFDSASGSWEPLANRTLRNNDCDGDFGAGLAWTRDGGLPVGCPLGNAVRPSRGEEIHAAGAVYYYRRSPSDGSYTLEQKLTAEDGRTLERFGGNDDHIATGSVGDLEVAAIGTYGRSSGYDERVYLFVKFDDWRGVASVGAPGDTSYFAIWGRCRSLGERDSGVLSGNRLSIN